MRFEGHHEVLHNLFRKQYLLDAGDGDHSKYRMVIVAGSGVNRGVNAGGDCISLDRLGLSQVFDTAVGISTGAPMLGFTLAGQIQKHLNIYWNEASGKNFISFERLWKGGRPVADTDYICEVFRSKMDQDAILRSRTQLYAAVTHVETGEGRLLDVKKVAPDPVEAMHASCAIPGLCGRVVTIDGVDYLDGAAAMSMPIREIIERFEPTDLLVLPNCPNEEKESMLGNLVGALLVRNFPEPFRKVYARRNEQFAEEIRYLRAQHNCRYAISWTDTTIGRFERNPLPLQMASMREEAYFSALLAEAKRHVDAENCTTLAAE